MGGGGGGGGVEGSCVRHSSSGRGLELVLPRLGEPANPTRREGCGMEASDNNLFFVFPLSTKTTSGSFMVLPVKLISPIICILKFLFSHLYNLSEQTEYKRAGSCSVIYN